MSIVSLSRSLCVSVAVVSAMFFAMAASAAEFKPIITLHVASPASVSGIVESVAQSVGKADDEFKAALNVFKTLPGVNANGSIGLAVGVSEEDQPEVVIVLPVTSIEKLNVPGQEAAIETFRAQLKKDGGKYIFSSPLGDVVAVQKEDYIVVALAKTIDNLPANPKTLFAGLEKYLIGGKVDFSNTSYDSLQGLIAPLGAVFMMQENGEEAFEVLQKTLKRYYEEFQSIQAGTTVNAKTFDIVTDFVVVLHEDSSISKTLRKMKNNKTAFSGFAGDPKKTVFSFNDVTPTGIHQDDIDELHKSADTIVESFIEGFSENVDDEAIVEKIKKLADKAVNSFEKIIEDEMKRGYNDLGFSLSSDGTLMGAGLFSETDELAKLCKTSVDAVQLLTEITESDFKFDFKKYVTNDYDTVADYKISKFVLPLADVIALVPDEGKEEIPATLKAMTVGAFWAVKKNHSIAYAVGLDLNGTEKAFKAALEKTKESVAVKQPAFVISGQQTGQLLKQFVLPAIADKDDDGADLARKIITSLAKVDDSAQVTGLSKVEGNTLSEEYKISGKLVEWLLSAIKEGIASAE